jgi:hypothetical protein
VIGKCGIPKSLFAFLISNDVEHIFMFNDHSYVFFGEVSIQILCLFFFNCVLLLLLSSCESSLYNLNKSALLDI